ncbi:MAG: TAT-variant-translocated molybdopterin oxidoreductase [Ignavibacteriaceae bacterium]|nr:TAT-variant-translocated molybdopterin oxidoreductase [Ignavibacteriaceae bacterium]
MKPEKSSNKKLDVNYWRSFEDLHNDSRIVEASHHEFKTGATENFNPSELSNISRRKFLALVGASAALAGAGCADYPDKGEIVPYNKKPEEVTLGKPNYYASTSSGCEHSCGVLVKTREGRPIKVEGNPDHPINKGKICLKCQAEILNLYDPERLKEPQKKVLSGVFDKITWKKANDEIIKSLMNIGDKEIAIILQGILSPSSLKVLNEFKIKYPSAQIYSYKFFNEDVRNSAWQKCYNSSHFPLIKWNEAKIIVALESDFLGSEGNRVENSALFVEGRDVSKIDEFNRLYVAEGNLSLTGMNADHRIRLRPHAQLDFVLSLITEICKKTGINSLLGGYKSLAEFAKQQNISLTILNALVSDLIKNKSKAIVHAGTTLPEEVHIAVNYLNELLGNTVLYRTDCSEVTLLPNSQMSDWENLINKMNSGKIGVVIHFNSNPVFHLADDYNYEKALAKVPMVVSLTEKENESSENANFVLPINHDFESWGDFKTRTGFYSLQQPIIAPLYNSRQKESILLTWISGKSETYNDKIYHEYLMNRWKTEVFPSLNSVLSFDRFWFGALHDGVVKVDEKVQTDFAFNSASLSELNSHKSAISGYSIVLKNNYSIGDGRLADNGWLQELPHPVSKIAWDNYASVSFATAKELNLKNNDLIEITIGSKTLKIPVFLQPGSADNTFTIELGYGRRKSGTVGTNVGFDAGVLLTKSNSGSPYLFTGKINKIDGTHELVTSQEHHMFDKALTNDAALKRKVIREGTVEEYKKNPKFLKQETEVELHTVYPFIDYPNEKWGMSIDLNKCLGCGDCVVSCTSENNVPIVGKDQVAKGREMQWIRIDRYYSGTAEDPNTSLQPMLCQHCDHAPCENVCPVVATTHSNDGLNQMAYNRCVGTRYCSNNCPYKVRRFNYFNYRDYFNDEYQESESFNLIYNPEVTVRSRGVMEKCTFCIQRIMEAREEAIRQNEKLKGSNVRTACQDACPTNAIQFGDINDKESEFQKYRNHELGYYVLEELNIKPNVTYIAKLRNTHAEEA